MSMAIYVSCSLEVKFLIVERPCVLDQIIPLWIPGTEPWHGALVWSLKNKEVFWSGLMYCLCVEP